MHLSRYTTRKRALKSHRLSETPIVWGNTSDLFTPRGLDIIVYRANELKESDGELRCSCLRDNPLAYNLVLVSLQHPPLWFLQYKFRTSSFSEGCQIWSDSACQQSDRRLSTMNPLLTPRYVGASVCASTHSCIKLFAHTRQHVLTRTHQQRQRPVIKQCTPISPWFRSELLVIC